MHKYRAAAKQAAWYSDADDAPNYNPFRKTRTRYGDETAIIDKAQPLQDLASPSNSDEEVLKDEGHVVEYLEFEEPPEKTQSVAQVHPPATFDQQHGSVDEEHGISTPPRALASWRSWSERKVSHLWRQLVLASGSRRSGDVKRSVAGMGLSALSHAPLGTKGFPFFQGAGRRKRFMVIDYSSWGGNTNGGHLQTLHDMPLSN